jgi:hypothetical protein
MGGGEANKQGRQYSLNDTVLKQHGVFLPTMDCVLYGCRVATGFWVMPIGSMAAAHNLGGGVAEGGTAVKRILGPDKRPF